MSASIAVVDYGMGNLRSVQKALEKVGAKTKVTDRPSDLRSASAIVLPGVGAFGQAMARLRAAGLIAPLKEAIDAKKPFFGICLGLQMLFERSEENPTVRGLGVLPGDVVLFRGPRVGRRKVPHMGWNTFKVSAPKTAPVLDSVQGDYFYFVHSYYPSPRKKSAISARTEYGVQFCSAVEQENLIATQFHPEKSGDSGLRLLKNFVKRIPC